MFVGSHKTTITTRTNLRKLKGLRHSGMWEILNTLKVNKRKPTRTSHRKLEWLGHTGT